MVSVDAERVSFKEVLEQGDFFRVWLSQTVSVIGDRLTQVALAIYVLQLAGGSAAAVGAFLAVQTLPHVLVGPVSGVLVDRWDKRRTMVASDLVRGIIIALVPLIEDTRLLYLAAFLMASVSTVFMPALQSALPDLVRSRQEILVANSLTYTTRYMTDILGFAFGAAVVAFIGLKVAFLLDALTYLVSAALLLGIRKKLHSGDSPRLSLRKVGADLAAGLRYIRRAPVVYSLLISSTWGVLFMGALNALLLVAIDRVLGVERFWYGYLLAVQAVSMALTAVAIGQWAQRTRRVHLYLGGFFGIGVCAVAIAVTRSLPVAFLIYAALGVANTAFLIPSITWLQEVVPSEVRGRVMGLRLMVINAAGSFSLAAGGFLGDAVGVTPVLVATGVLLMAAAAGSAALPGLREALLGREDHVGV